MRDLAKRLLYSSGALGLYHRIKNAGSLTVVMFHRVIDREDPRWHVCDPDYTLERRVFADSLRFFRRHYNVVSHDEVLHARMAGVPLPPRALLITFDDGWADNADFALPELKRAGLPAHMFVVSDVVGRRQPFFQERIVSAFRRGALRVGELAAVLPARGEGEGMALGEDLDALREVIARLEALGREERETLLLPFAAALDDGMRHMVDIEDLRALMDGGVTLGLHGATHTWMTRVEDLDAELGGAREALRRQLEGAPPAADSMSFPYGAHTPEIARRALEAGYRLVMTSVPVLNPGDSPGWLLGRIGFDTGTVVDAAQRFRPDLLALYLFRRGIQPLA